MSDLESIMYAQSRVHATGIPSESKNIVDRALKLRALAAMLPLARWAKEFTEQASAVYGLEQSKVSIFTDSGSKNVERMGELTFGVRDDIVTVRRRLLVGGNSSDLREAHVEVSHGGDRAILRQGFFEDLAVDGVFVPEATEMNQMIEAFVARVDHQLSADFNEQEYVGLLHSGSLYDVLAPSYYPPREGHLVVWPDELAPVTGLDDAVAAALEQIEEFARDQHAWWVSNGQAHPSIPVRFEAMAWVADVLGDQAVSTRLRNDANRASAALAGLVSDATVTSADAYRSYCDAQFALLEQLPGPSGGSAVGQEEVVSRLAELSEHIDARLGRGNPYAAMAIEELGKRNELLGRYAEALIAYQELVERADLFVREQVVRGIGPRSAEENVAYRNVGFDVAIARNLRRLGRSAESLVVSTQCMQCITDLCDQEATRSSPIGEIQISSFLMHEVEALMEHAQCLIANGQFAEALNIGNRIVLRAVEQLKFGYPVDAHSDYDGSFLSTHESKQQYVEAAANCIPELTEVFFRNGRPDEAEQMARNSALFVEIAGRVFEASGAGRDVREAVANSHVATVTLIEQNRQDGVMAAARVSAQQQLGIHGLG